MARHHRALAGAESGMRSRSHGEGALAHGLFTLWWSAARERRSFPECSRGIEPRSVGDRDVGVQRVLLGVWGKDSGEVGQKDHCPPGETETEPKTQHTRCSRTHVGKESILRWLVEQDAIYERMILVVRTPGTSVVPKFSPTLCKSVIVCAVVEFEWRRSV